MTPEGDQENPASIWSRVASRAREENPSILSVVESTKLESLSGGGARVAIVSDSNTAYVRARKAALEDLLEKETGKALRIDLVDAFDPGAGGPESKEIDHPRPEIDPVAQAAAMKDPVVRRAVELFDARVVEITPDEPDADEGGR